MNVNTKKTSQEIGTLAAGILRDENASKIQKSLAGSALSQVNSQRQTGTTMEDKASQVLDSPKYSDITKSLAGSVLTQSNKER